VIIIEQLRELQAEFEPVRLDNQSRYKKLETLRLRFVKLFPRSRIPHLTADGYVQGKLNKQSFCYWVETETTELGHIQGAPSPKFGIYYSKKKNSFQFTKKFKSKDDAIASILNQIGLLLDAAESANLEAVRNTDISPMFKGKILFLYFPKRFVNIFSGRLVDHFLGWLRLNEPDSKLDLISKRELLIKFKNADSVMKGWSTFEFHDFLHWAWPPPPREAKVNTLLKDYILELPLPENTRPEFISLKPGDAVDSSEKASGKKAKTTDFEQKNRRNKLIGNQGEDIVFLAEKRMLRENGKPDLAKKVEAICKTNDGAGYDILSFELDGTPKQIEVKSTASRVPVPSSSFGFYLSANEYEQARTLDNFYLYIVFELKTKTPKIWRIKNPASLEPKRLALKPSAYFATLTVAEDGIESFGNCSLIESQRSSIPQPRFGPSRTGEELP